jgi:hypothetical protein
VPNVLLLSPNDFPEPEVLALKLPESFDELTFTVRRHTWPSGMGLPQS